MISFIIPAYNAEKYILSCINKILQLSYSDFEIVVINDGSTDRTGELPNEIRDNRIRVFNQKNQGVSAARNFGISQAKGSWLMFIDVDDYVIPAQLDMILNTVTNRNDLYMFAYEEEKNGQVRKVDLPISPGDYTDSYELIELGNRLLDVKFSKNYNCRYFGGKVYQYLFSRDFLQRNKITFPDKIHFAEDCVFCLSCFRKAQSLTVLDITGYHYIIYDDSASHRYRENFWIELKNFYSCICEIEDKEPDNKWELFFYYGNDVIKRAMLHFSRIRDRKKALLDISQVVCDEDFNSSIKNIKFDRWSIKEKVLINLCLQKKSGYVYWWLFFCDRMIDLKYRLKGL